MSKKSIFYTTADLNYSDVSPTLDLNFVENQKVPPFVNVTRNSQTTYVDKFGILRTADINQPVFEWDPITGKCLGARIWGAVTNFILQSENLGASWTLFNSSVSLNSHIAPNGTLTADSVTPSNGLLDGLSRQNISGLPDNASLSGFVFVKSAGINAVSLQFYNKANTFHFSGSVNLTTGAIEASPFNMSTEVLRFPNGWYQIRVTGFNSGSGATTPNLRIASSVAGNGSNAFVQWGAQLQVGSTLGPYVPTTTTAASSTADVWSITGADAARIINTAEGTLYVDFATGSAVPADQYPSPIQLQGASRQNEVQIYAATGVVAYLVKTGNITQAEANLSATTQNGVKSAFRYAENNSRSYVNGSPLLLDTVCTMPTTDRIFIGSVNGSDGFLNGYIRRLTIYPKRLTNSQLVQLTE